MYESGSVSHTKTIHSASNHSFLERENRIAYKEVDSSFFPKDLNIVALGDSLTSGYGDNSGNGGYVKVLEYSLGLQRGIGNITISNLAKGGLYSDQLIKELNNGTVQEFITEADYILLTIGGNDLMRVAKENIFSLTSEPFEKGNLSFTANLNIIVNKIKFHNPNAKLFFVGIYNPFSSLFASVPEIDLIIENWNEGTDNVLSKYENTYFIPISDLFKGNEDRYLFADYIHPNEEGYKQLANRVLSYLGQFDHHSIYVNGVLDASSN